MVEFIWAKQNPKLQALMVRRLIHLLDQTQVLGPGRIVRPQVEGLSGAVKEYRHLGDRQLRILFSWERNDHIILLLNGTRKKTNPLDRKLIEKAVELREMWLAGKTALPFDTALRHGGLGAR